MVLITFLTKLINTHTYVHTHSDIYLLQHTVTHTKTNKGSLAFVSFVLSLYEDNRSQFPWEDRVCWNNVHKQPARREWMFKKKNHTNIKTQIRFNTHTHRIVQPRRSRIHIDHPSLHVDLTLFRNNFFQWNFFPFTNEIKKKSNVLIFKSQTG